MQSIIATFVYKNKDCIYKNKSFVCKHSASCVFSPNFYKAFLFILSNKMAVNRSSRFSLLFLYPVL